MPKKKLTTAQANRMLGKTLNEIDRQIKILQKLDFIVGGDWAENFCVMDKHTPITVRLKEYFKGNWGYYDPEAEG